MAERQTTQTTLKLRTLWLFDFFTFSDDTLTERLMNPECSHCVAYSYLWPVVMNVSWSSLHSTLYTVWVQVVFRGQVNCWAHRPPSGSSAVSRQLEDVLEEVHRSHDVFILRQTDKKVMRWRVKKDRRQRETCRDVRLTFWQQSMNSSMVTTPSLFLSIFCRRENGRLERCFLKAHSAVEAADRSLAWKNTSTCWRGVSSLRMGYVHFPIMS